MISPSSIRRLAAELLGTAFLVAAVVGSGIMADKRTGGNEALALLCNTVPTGSILVVLILIFAPISGAHFNPAVTLAFWFRGEIAAGALGAYVAAQIAGGILGTLVAHAMFDVSLFQLSLKIRTGLAQWLSEFIAAFGLLLTIFGVRQQAANAIPYAVGLYITSAYWFTASTSFANPAVTIARALTESFSGIAPSSAPAFIVAQSAGALAATWLAHWLFAEPCEKPAVSIP